MKQVPTIRSVMTPMPHSIDANETMLEAQRLMEEYAVRHLPVTESGALIGLVSDRDLRRVLDPVFNVPPLRQVREVMIRDPYVVAMDAPLDEVLLQLAERRIGCVLVAEGKRVTGIFTTTDATRLLGELLRAQGAAGIPDPA